MPYQILKKFKLSAKKQISTDLIENKDYVLSVPTKSGVYVVSTDYEVSRLRGKSDILYIGRSNNLRRRMKFLLKYFLPLGFVGNWGKHTAREALKIILEETDINVYIAYTVCGNQKAVEKKLLQKFCKNHIETPPLNNQRS